MWDVVGWIGFVFNVVGAAVAIWAVIVEVRHKNIYPVWRRAFTNSVEWFQTRVLRQHRRVVMHTGTGWGVAAGGTTTFTGSATGYVSSGDPVDDRLRLLEATTERLEAEAKANRERDLKQLEATRTALEERIGDVEKRIEAETREKQIETTTKNWEMWGLGLVAVGTALQGAATIFG